ncbi:dehydrogenase [Sphingobium sp. SCG-1]|uniref:SDR family NAD(P)-dependent oxidoreductase n=1 Tax=Sphingobium sp. SCG-1 TaxID=2072936 RepID=UPI000CD68F35|nr:glucose 1-dehydrogenase [Sphingobium sp. SCG-1]AUW59653.1 dehydrogenase [Sphingobium sp. SCG-1]
MASEKRVAIVTGGASGIGFAFSSKLAESGYAVVIADLRGAQEAAAKIVEAGYDALGVTVDVTSEVDTTRMVDEATKAFGGLNVLVNNAGLFTTLTLKPVDQISAAEWMKVMEVNTLGPFLCIKAALPALRASGGGRIVNVASTSPIKGTPFMQHYTASKGAVIGFTRSLARELGNENITVNAIAPGFTLSEGVLSAGMEERMGESARRTSRSIQRDQVPSDLVGALVFLASDGAAFITGQTIAVDGGGVCL